MSESCSVLVVSCGAYSDLWAPFFHLFWTHWADCPFPVYLGAAEGEWTDQRVQILRACATESWSANVADFVSAIDSDYVLLMLEDYFLDRNVNTAAIVRAVHVLKQLHGRMLRLVPQPGPDHAVPGIEGIGRLDAEAPYRVSTQAPVWKRTALLEILDRRESAWEFEWNGTERSRIFRDDFYAAYEPLLTYRHVVERGKWFWSAARQCRLRGVPCQFERRPVMTPWREAFKRVNAFRKTATDALLPPRLRRRR